MFLLIELSRDHTFPPCWSALPEADDLNLYVFMHCADVADMMIIDVPYKVESKCINV